jgi:hypothetical protein
MDGDATTISLELRLSAGSLSGRAENGDGGEREFSGWLGLLAAVDALLPPEPEPEEDS